MAEVRVVKPFRVSPAEPMRMPGDIVDVEGDLLDKLTRMGIVEDPAADPVVEEPAVEEPPEDSEPDPDPEPEPQIARSSDYPELPKKAAPLAEWEEYARVNEIKLTGLKTRNQKVGYIIKVASGD